MKKLKNRFLSCLLSAAMIISMVPSTLASGIDAQPLAAGDSITIQEQSIKSITTAATSVTVQVTGYENRSSAKLTLNKFLNGMRSLLSLLSVSTLSLMAM